MLFTTSFASAAGLDREAKVTSASLRFGRKRGRRANARDWTGQGVTAITLSRVLATLALVATASVVAQTPVPLELGDAVRIARDRS